MLSVLSVCLSVCVSRITHQLVYGCRLNMAEMVKGNLYKWLNFVIDSDQDVDLESGFSLSLTLGEGHFIRYIATQ